MSGNFLFSHIRSATILTFFLYNISTPLTAQFPSISDTPTWVTERPYDQTAYTGIGIVSKGGRADSEIKTEANRLAFEEISNQIYAAISSSYEEVLRQENEEFQERSKSILKASTASDLEGLELVGSHDDGKKYYVFWKLDKSVHEANLEKYGTVAKQMFEKSTKVLLTDAIGELSFLVKAYENLQKAPGKIISYEGSDGELVLNVQIPKRIEEIISKVSTSGGNTRQTGRPNERLDGDLIFNASYDALITVTLMGLPVEFRVINGDLEMETQKTTDANGQARTSVLKIKSDEPDQLVRAFVDLKKFKTQEVPNAVLDQVLDDISMSRSVDYVIDVSGLISEVIAVKVVPEIGIAPSDINFINEIFIAEIGNNTKFEVLERGYMDEILQEQGYNAECSTDECQVEIGKMLSVRKMIFIILQARGTGSQQTFRASMKLTNIETGKNEHMKQVKYKGDVDDLLDIGIGKWVKEFYASINLPKVTFLSSNYNVHVYKDGDYWNDIPIRDEELEPGQYKMNFILPGFETQKKTFNLALGQNLEERIELEQKTRTEAMMKSFLLPGYGQWYSSDNAHNGRRVMGTTFAVATLAAIAGTVATWSSYMDASSTYDASRADYLAQDSMGDIDSYRKIMEDDHDTMSSAKSTAWIVTGLLGTIWVASGIEAMLNFPTDYGVGASFSYDPVHEQNQLNLYKTF